MRGSYCLYIVLFFTLIFPAGCGKDFSGIIGDVRFGGVEAALLNVASQMKEVDAFKATGRCKLVYYDEGKKHKEAFSCKMWVLVPDMIRFQGDVVFNPRGLDVGSNGKEFWVGMKPRELGNVYFWGLWSEQGEFDRLKLDPRMMLEGLGILSVEADGFWEVQDTGKCDALLAKTEGGEILKKFYFDNDLRVVKIEYYDGEGFLVVTSELSYLKNRAIQVPGFVRIKTHFEDESDFSLEVNIRSAKLYEFDDKSTRMFFGRREPRGYKKIYRVLGGRSVEQE